MALLSTIDRVTTEVLQSKWTVLLELVLILVPITLFMTPALLLLSLVVAVNPFAVVPLTLTAVGGIWGLVSLWRCLFSLFRPFAAPAWAHLGLIAGSLTVICFYYLGKNRLGWLLVCVPVALHWFWLKRRGIVLSFKGTNAPG